MPLKKNLFFWCPDENHPSPIVLCPHDWHMATVYAPHFEGFLYRQIIDFATDGIEVEDDEEGRQWIHNWQFVFHDFLPSEWIDTLQDIATRPLIKPEPDSHYTGLITEAENHEIVQRDLAFARLNEEFVWWQES